MNYTWTVASDEYKNLDVNDPIDRAIKNLVDCIEASKGWCKEDLAAGIVNAIDEHMTSLIEEDEWARANDEDERDGWYDTEVDG